MVATFTDDFQVVWQDPADANLTWIFDQMHFPRPLSPTAGELVKGLYEQYMNGRATYVNGYLFVHGLNPPPPTPDILERGAADVWNKVHQPFMQAAAQRLIETDYGRMKLSELGDAMPGILQESIDTYSHSMVVITGFMGPTFGFVQFLSDELGPDGPQLAASLLQGYENGSAAAGASLGGLAESAARLPAVAEALRQGNYDAIEGVEGGAAFMDEFRDFLKAYGWRLESWGTVHEPTWAENPRVPLMLIGRYLHDPSRSPAAAISRAIALREQTVREVETKLSPDKLPQFRAMLQACQNHVPVSEGRALWQLITGGSLRVPFLALGRGLVEAGALADANDVFFLTTQELKEAANNPSPSYGTLATKRRADHERWEKLAPPPFVGSPPDMAHMPPEIVALLHLFFGAGAPQIEGQTIKGQAASKGVARGRARIIHELSEADRLQDGEILVCRMTAPPWTPLFAIAGGVVTDTGGVLSHSAICAREYAIPCVVATQVATRVIPDGAMIEVDGTAGTVRIEG
jgi:pyruvate,water dikinase